MTLLLLESADTVSSSSELQLKGWTAYNTGDGLSLAGGRTGNGIYILTKSDFFDTPAWLGQQRPPGDEHVTFTLGFAIYIPQLTSPGIGGFSGCSNFVRLMSDALATTHVAMGMNLGGQLFAYAGPGLPTVGSSSVMMVPAAWNYLELSATLGSLGSVTVNLNDSTIISATGINTKNGGTKTTFDSIMFGGPLTGAPQFKGALVIDDIYLTNGAGSIHTGMLGDLRVPVITPDNNGAVSGMENSMGNMTNNYSYVNSGFQTTTFVASDTPGTEDVYEMTALPWPAGNVLGVQTVLLADKDNAGARSVMPVMRIGSTDYTGTSTVLSSSAQYQQEVFEQNPATSAAWTVTDVNNVQLGMRVA